MGKTEGESMKILVDTDDVKQLGSIKAFLLGWCRANSTFKIKELVEASGLSETAVRTHINDLEDMKYLERVYGVSEEYLSKRKRGYGRKYIMLGVKVYD